jgi:GTPase SAR1 family protein
MPPQLVAYAQALFGTEGALRPDSPSNVINLSLISHTNAGKTTLARTLLRRDVGEVRDAPHVTTRVTAYELIATPQGDVLQLWDTPGFNGTERLANRLHLSANPIGWLMSQVWDRMTDAISS